MAAQDLFEAARHAMARAHAPYSRFPVGAAILADDGRIYCGANIEVVSFPEGWCAETTALSHMVMGGGKRIREVAVIAEKMARCTPCGGCRQRLAEFGDAETKVHLCDGDGPVETLTLAALLPMAFESETLK